MLTVELPKKLLKMCKLNEKKKMSMFFRNKAIAMLVDRSK